MRDCRLALAAPARPSTPGSPPTCYPPGSVSRAEACRQLARLLAQQPPLPRYERKKLSDTEVLALIKDGLDQSPGTSASRLLRQIRDAGYACEQRRFGHLFQAFRENAT